jgi:serine/threonine protein kinase
VCVCVQIFIVLELIAGGELFDKIVAEGRFDEATARFYFRQLIRGVKYCHLQGVCHRDLKPEVIIYLLSFEALCLYDLFRCFLLLEPPD